MLYLKTPINPLIMENGEIAAVVFHNALQYIIVGAQLYCLIMTKNN